MRILRLDWEAFRPISEVVRMIHEYSLKPSSFTKWVRPLRKTPEMRPKPAGSVEQPQVNVAA